MIDVVRHNIRHRDIMIDKILELLDHIYGNDKNPDARSDQDKRYQEIS